MGVSVGANSFNSEYWFLIVRLAIKRIPVQIEQGTFLPLLAGSHPMAIWLYLYSDNHVLWAWNTKAAPMNYLDTKAVPKRKFFSANHIKEVISFFVAHTPVIKNEDL